MGQEQSLGYASSHVVFKPSKHNTTAKKSLHPRHWTLFKEGNKVSNSWLKNETVYPQAH